LTAQLFLVIKLQKQGDSDHVHKQLILQLW